MLSGLIHVVVWLVMGGDWEGPVSWRKPILFGFSTGMTVLSIAWFFPKLRPGRWDSLLCGLFGAAMVAEVGLITLQAWRGEASHFNHSTAVNSLIENWMTYLIVFATLALMEFTRRCHLRLDASSDMRLAIRGGMAFLILSCLIGFFILFYGSSQASKGADPSTFGEAGVMKFPHGVAIHAIQFFPFVCWILHKIGIPSGRRTRIVGYLIASTSMFLLFSLVQTLNGRARYDLTVSGSLLLIAASACLLPVLGELVGFKMPKRGR
ncbi:MAG: hypothetical protein ACI87E_003311 [Mariniblastus sp.]|jgi:hypothetical protein